MVSIDKLFSNYRVKKEKSLNPRVISQQSNLTAFIYNSGRINMIKA